MIVVGKHEASIVEHHVALALEHGHVLTDGVKAAERMIFSVAPRSFFEESKERLRARTLTALIGVALFRELRALKVKLDVLDRLRTLPLFSGRAHHRCASSAVRF